ncbi:hypothetical protein [Pseudomonas sp. MWU16-30323]|uniref:hypothetical protein n=1 Tax=Pseudomonas sp. MWU16-30323 TaxID=2878094 RepID=UPI001CFB76C2|nr:hypothetical protein [Pseudomonas sp. MWU16-30323]
MRKHIKAAALLLASFSMLVGAVMANETLPSSTAVHYEKKELYGVWYINLNEGNSKGVALLVLHENGTATDYLMVSDQKIIQKSSWSYDAERNLFEQTVSEVSIQNGKSAAVVSHPHEVIRASISLAKLGDEVIGIKFKKDDGELTGYLKGSDRMLDVITQ